MQVKLITIMFLPPLSYVYMTGCHVAIARRWCLNDTPITSGGPAQSTLWQEPKHTNKAENEYSSSQSGREFSLNVPVSPKKIFGKKNQEIKGVIFQGLNQNCWRVISVFILHGLTGGNGDLGLRAKTDYSFI